jgi:thiol-disulfide isomerase/thioredoxin
VSSQNFAGKVAVLSFGAIWCASCVSELRSLVKIRMRFVDDVVVYFVAPDGQGEKDVKPFMEKVGFRLLILLDPHIAAAREHRVRSIPETVIVDRQGFPPGERGVEREDGAHVPAATFRARPSMLMTSSKQIPATGFIATRGAPA